MKRKLCAAIVCVLGCFAGIQAQAQMEEIVVYGSAGFDGNCYANMHTEYCQWLYYYSMTGQDASSSGYGSAAAGGAVAAGLSIRQADALADEIMDELDELKDHTLRSKDQAAVRVSRLQQALKELEAIEKKRPGGAAGTYIETVKSRMATVLQGISKLSGTLSSVHNPTITAAAKVLGLNATTVLNSVRAGSAFTILRSGASWILRAAGSTVIMAWELVNGVLEYQDQQSQYYYLYMTYGQHCAEQMMRTGGYCEI